MTDKKRWGDRIVGWFVERDGSPEGAPAAPQAGPEDNAPPPPEGKAPVQLRGRVPDAPEPGGTLDFAAVYRAAGIPAEAQDRVDKAITMLQTLPADAPDAIKRQIVEASLKAFGYPVAQIVEAAEAEIRALQAFIELGARNTQKLVADSNARIEALTQEISAIREDLEQKQSAQARLSEHCTEQQGRMQQVLDFFEAGVPAPEAPAPTEEKADGDEERGAQTEERDEKPAGGS